MVSKKLGMNKPLSKQERNAFLSESPDIKSAIQIDGEKLHNKFKTSSNENAIKKTITMYQNDLDILNSMIDRCVSLGVKDKGISGAIRMSLMALQKTDDKIFMEIYNKTK